MKFRHVFFSGLLGLGLTLGVSAQDFNSVSSSAKADLEKALTELSALQKQVGEERIPIAQTLSKAEDTVLTKRKDYEKAQRSRDNELVDLNVLKDQVKKKREELDYLNGLLQEFSSLFESRLHISELQVYADQSREVRLKAENPDLSIQSRLELQMGFVDRAIERLNHLSGGHTFDASVLGASGVKEKGKVTLLGPVAIFASAQGGGLVDRQVGSLEPAVISLDPTLTGGIKTVVETGSGGLPLDASLGNALKIEATKDGFIEHIVKGGFVMYPIVGIALAALIVGIIKWFQLTSIPMASRRDLQLILDRLTKGNQQGALEHAETIKGPSGQLLATAVTHAQESKEYIEEVLYERMLNVKPVLEKMLPFIALTAATAPLLGLLGTVTGMITTFNMISVFGTGDPKTLSGGISEALITTEWGLYVAIPALLIHSVLSRKVKAIMGDMEQMSVAFINGVPEQIPAEPVK
ncbi:MAG TPA: MotA/TolQ/ExbB proton channel family protein [Verrucomicrobiae bacterium]